MLHLVLIAAVLTDVPVTSTMLLNNDTQNIARSFSGFFLSVTDEPIDYFDVREGSGSGIGEKEHHPDRSRGKSHVSEEASGFLTGSMMTILIPTIYTLVFIISVPLNGLAFYMFVRRVQLKKPSVMYMMNLACADLLFALLLPFRIAYHYNGNNWIYGSMMCNIVTAAFYCNMYCSVLLIMCIAVDRYMGIVHPMDSLRWRRPTTAVAVCITMWLLSISGVIPLLISEQTFHVESLGITTCHDVLEVHHQRAYYLYFFPIYSSVFFFIPFIFTMVCYLRIIQVLCKPGMTAGSKKSRAVAMTATVFSVFAVCFAPTNIILMTHYVHIATSNSDASFAAYLVATCLGSVSCCVDPVLYYFGSSRCQRQFLAILKCHSESELEHSQLSSRSTTSSKLETLKSNLSSEYKQLVA